MQHLEVSGAVRYTHTHTHIYIYIYIYFISRLKVKYNFDISLQFKIFLRIPRIHMWGGEAQLHVFLTTALFGGLFNFAPQTKNSRCPITEAGWGLKSVWT